MTEVSTIGRQLRMLRREHGVTQETLAEQAGVSKDVIAKLEQGRRQGVRVSTLAALARALDTDMSELTDKRDRIGPDRDGGSVLAVRDALLSPTLLPGLAGLDPDDDGDPTPLPELRRSVTEAWDHYWAGDFGALAALVPALISEARITHRGVGEAASGPLAQVYQLAACLMVHLGKDDLAALGAERAITAAHNGDDQFQWATVQGTYSWVLLHQGRLSEAEHLAVTVAEQIEPSFSAPAPHVAAWGNLLMTALAPAAAAGRDVTDYVSMATAGAERIGHRTDVYQTAFGPAIVAMQAVHAYAVMREPAKALRAARRIRPGDLKGISAGRHLLDVAQAQTDARQRRAAVVTLQQARDLSPVWFRHQGIARSLVRDIREEESRPSPAVRSLVASLGIER